MKKQISFPIKFDKWYVTVTSMYGLPYIKCTKCKFYFFNDAKIKRRVKCPECGNRV